MTFWDKIDHPRFFGRVRDEEVAAQMPADLKPMVEHLVHEHRMAMTGLYLANYRSPELVVVMNEALPLDALRRVFPETDRLRFTEFAVLSDVTWSELAGPQD